MFYCIAYDKPYYLLNYYCGFNGFGSTYESVYTAHTLWLHLVNEPNVNWLYLYSRQCIMCTTNLIASFIMSIMYFIGNFVNNHLEY